MCATAETQLLFTCLHRIFIEGGPLDWALLRGCTQSVKGSTGVSCNYLEARKATSRGVMTTERTIVMCGKGICKANGSCTHL